MVPALEMRRARFLNPSSRRPSLTQGSFARWHVPMLPAFFASKIAIRNKGRVHTFPSLKENKVPSPPGKKSWLRIISLSDCWTLHIQHVTSNSSHGFQWRLLFSPSLPPQKAKSSRENWQNELICSSFSKYANNWVRLLGRKWREWGRGKRWDN